MPESRTRPWLSRGKVDKGSCGKRADHCLSRDELRKIFDAQVVKLCSLTDEQIDRVNKNSAGTHIVGITIFVRCN